MIGLFHSSIPVKAHLSRVPDETGMYANTLTPTVDRINHTVRPTADGIINYHQLPMKMENSYYIGRLW